VTFIRLAANTHNYDMNQRYLELSFAGSSGALTVQAPATPNLAPPGYYMLFIVDGNGAVSTAQMVWLH
jgi:hypothetical protein